MSHVVITTLFPVTSSLDLPYTMEVPTKPDVKEEELKANGKKSGAAEKSGKKKKNRDKGNVLPSGWCPQS